MDEKTLELINKSRMSAENAAIKMAPILNQDRSGAIKDLIESVQVLCHALERTNRKVADIDGGRPRT